MKLWEIRHLSNDELEEALRREARNFNEVGEDSNPRVGYRSQAFVVSLTAETVLRLWAERRRKPIN